MVRKGKALNLTGREVVVYERDLSGYLVSSLYVTVIGSLLQSKQIVHYRDTLTESRFVAIASRDHVVVAE